MGKHPAWLGKAMQTGGRAKPWQGGDPAGRSPQWQGEGDSGKPMKEEAQKVRNSAAGDMAKAAALIPGGATSAIVGRGIGKIPGILAGALGAGYGKRASDDRNRASAINEEADKSEGRKRGGRAKKKD